MYDVATEEYVVVVRPLGPGRPVIRKRFIASPPGQPEFDCETIWTLHVEGPAFLRGDCNDDGNVDISDAVCTLNWLFLGGAEPGCVAAANANGDEAIDLSDAVSVLNFLFLGGPALAHYPVRTASLRTSFLRSLALARRSRHPERCGSQQWPE